ncbi:MAG TPA: non-ribosomal peptide synthetase, partial [Thermoanaerobaculia bacterium]|nr:non-ribosomal peptide synthetase [Thermoanaerobaculia bacterium]
AGRLLAKIAPGGEVWNVYGPTETTVWSAVGRVAPGAGPVPVGRPIDGTRMAVMDRDGLPCPPGVAGELWIGGAGVARGYRGQPAATAERFVPDPCGPAAGRAAGARAYRTGDLARWDGDGSLKCLGRIDHQVKVRGHRIEPEEIEAALGARPDVARAAVVPVPGPGGGLRLAAWLVLEPGRPEPTVAELRADLEARLPPYMVPAAFSVVPELPATSSGKLDRRALPRLAAARPVAGEDYTAPETEVELALAAVWREVLGVERVGRRDRFFGLGGDSVLALQAVTRAARAGLEVTVPDFFRHATLADLAGAARPLSGPAPSPVAPIPAAGGPDAAVAGLGAEELEELLAEIESSDRTVR